MTSFTVVAPPLLLLGEAEKRRAGERAALRQLLAAPQRGVSGSTQPGESR